MASDRDLLKAGEIVQKAIQVVKQDLRDRPDYGDQHAAEIKALDTLTLGVARLLGKLAVESVVTPGVLMKLSKQIEDETLPQIADMLHANTRMAKMGPLNTRQTISPKRALSINANLSALQNDIFDLGVQLSLVHDRVHPTPAQEADPVSPAHIAPPPEQKDMLKKALSPEAPPSLPLPPPTVSPPPSLKELAGDFRTLLKNIGAQLPQK